MLRHKKHASAFIAFLMAFALIFTSSGIGSLTFTKADDTQTIYYNGDSFRACIICKSEFSFFKRIFI